jgi:hypothetical protein
MKMMRGSMKVMQTTGLYIKLIVIALLVVSVTIAPIFSAPITTAIIENTGTIGNVGEVTAESGYWQDIQTAINQVVAQGGIGNVRIPAGTFNFVNVGEQWTGARVTIPAGVNLLGANTERDAAGQVTEWKTILIMPYDVPGPSNNPPTWFKINGNSNPSKPSRFSDIKLQGYRFLNQNSVTVHRAIELYAVVNFRIDHCYFRDTTGGIFVGGPANSKSCGVIDHCKLINSRVTVRWYIYDCDVHYGVGCTRYSSTIWEDDINKVLGKYLDYSVYIEDCYFEKWRHCVSANEGAHYVFRHNTIKNDVALGSLDAHGTYNYVGTRAVEIYNNQILDPVGNAEGVLDTIYIRGGGGVIFNNVVNGYNRFVFTYREGSVEKCWPHDLWIWGNTLGGIHPVIVYYNSTIGGPVEGVDYFLYEKTDYTPYPYPHPLTLE